MEDRRHDPMGILPTQSGPDITSEAHDWPDVAQEGPGDGARIVTIRGDDDLDALGDADESWARFEAFDEERITEALVFGARAVIVPKGPERDVSMAFDPDAFLFEDGDTLRDVEGRPAYEKMDGAWLRRVDDE